MGQWQREKALGSKEPVLSVAEDPEGKYLSVQEMWNIGQPLDVADLTKSSKILPMDTVLLTEGDFVDVRAELDFVLSRE